MNTQLFKRLWRKVEPWIAGLLLLYGWELALPSALIGTMKPASYGILLILIIPLWKKCFYVATRDIPLLLLVGMVFVSVFWSVAPDFTADESKAVLRSTLYGVYLATRYTPREQMRLIGWVLLIAALLSLGYALALPSEGIAMTNNEISWKGVFTHKQYLGRQMALGCGVFLLTAVESKKLRWVALAALSLMVLLILLSRSKTALILLLLTLLMLPMYKVVKQQYKLQVFIYLIALVLIGSVAIFIVSNLEFILVDTLGKDLEFNGRVPIWILILDKAFERPWLGYGFAGFWTSPESLYVLNNTWAGTQASIEEGVRFHAHNGFIDLFIQLGLLGLSLFIFNFIKVFLKVISVLNYTKAVEFFWMLQFLVLMLVFNLSEVITILSTGTLWTLYVSIALSTSVQQNRIRKSQYLGASALKS